MYGKAAICLILVILLLTTTFAGCGVLGGLVDLFEEIGYEVSDLVDFLSVNPYEVGTQTIPVTSSHMLL